MRQKVSRIFWKSLQMPAAREIHTIKTEDKHYRKIRRGLDEEECEEKRSTRSIRCILAMR